MAAVFSFVHLQILQLTAFPAAGFIIVFLGGLLLGWIMQRTGSVLAPALLHAGLIMLIIADSFAAFGTRS